MRRAGLVVWEAHQIAARLVKPGVTTAEIDAAIEAFFVEKNAVPLFKGVPGKVPFPAVTCISVNEEVVHGIPGPRKLVSGDVVSIDTGCKVDGWCGDSAVTHPVGEVDPEVQRLLDVTRGTLELAIQLMGTRQRWSEVAREMEVFVKDAGFFVVENFVGHGIGREMHEDPQVPNFVSPQLRRGNDFELRPGLVIAVEPMVNMGTKRVKGLSDHWTQVAVDGRQSAHFEHTIAITKEGPADGQPGRSGYSAVGSRVGGRVRAVSASGGWCQELASGPSQPQMPAKFCQVNQLTSKKAKILVWRGL
jgi:methionyl aminopeptidase